MNNIKAKIEALLFVAAKPLQLKELASLITAKNDELIIALQELSEDCEREKRGVRVVKQGTSYQLVTAPEQAELIKDFIKDETMGELSKPSLEALTIIAYRGPISKLDLDRIRGVNCALILRNLLLHGLIEAKFDKQKDDTYYTVTIDFVRFLGINDISLLPDFEFLRQHDSLERILKDAA
ncbi:MAG TPA: SMC-Scp complex subunit ScpB [bacterium]|nr:SMC-Scp complex subunit ScpB [bacterium]